MNEEQTAPPNTLVEGGETKVVRGDKEIIEVSFAVTDRAVTSSYLAAVTDDKIPKETKPVVEYVKGMFARNPGFRFEMIVDLRRENMDYYRQVMDAGIDVKHIEDNKVSFLLSKGEYCATPLSAMDEQVSSGAATPREIVWSTSADVVSQAHQIFQLMWRSATPGRLRIRALEEGTEAQSLRVVTSPAEVRDIYVRLVQQAHEEVLLLLPTSNAFHRQEKIGIFDSLAQAARRGAVVQILSPIDAAIGAGPQGIPIQSGSAEKGMADAQGKGSITLKAIQQARGGNGITVLVVDKSATLVIEERDSSTPDFADAIGFATYATTGPTVNASIRFFERVMEDTELREREQALLEKERSSRRQAQLLQDILTHDIRNFVQVSKLSVDLLRQQLDSLRLAALLDSIDDAADGTTNLIDRAKKLARITEQIPELWLLDLRSPVERSVELITQANLKRAVTVTYAPELGGWSAAQVLADDLLDEVFRNILSNAVQYTDGVDVPIAIELTEEEADLAAAAEGAGGETRRTKCWKVAITDHGRGIDDKVKPRVFTRYQKSESGSGIGLSIVHALVVARYGGMVRVLDRVAGDPSKGTRVEVLLPRGPA